MNANHLIRLIRLPNLVILAASMYMTRYFLIMPLYKNVSVSLQMSHFDFALLVISTLLITAGGYIINDYFDVPIDKINRPETIIIGKHLSLKAASLMHIGISAVGVLVGLYAAWEIGSIKLGFIQLVLTTVLWFYSTRYKRNVLVGNIVVAVLSAFAIAMVWLFEFFAVINAVNDNNFAFADLQGAFHAINTVVISYTLFAFLVTLVRELAKDAEDIEGDRKNGCRTFPIVYGLKTTNKVLFYITLFAILLLAFGQFELFIGVFPVTALFFLLVQGLFVYTMMKLQKASSKQEYHHISIMYKIIIVAGVLSMQLMFIES